MSGCLSRPASCFDSAAPALGRGPGPVPAHEVESQVNGQDRQAQARSQPGQCPLDHASVSRWLRERNGHECRLRVIARLASRERKRVAHARLPMIFASAVKSPICSSMGLDVNRGSKPAKSQAEQPAALTWPIRVRRVVSRSDGKRRLRSRADSAIRALEQTDQASAQASRAVHARCQHCCRRWRRRDWRSQAAGRGEQ